MANPFKAHPRVKNTDGRVPSVNMGGPKEDEGNTTMKLKGDGSIGTNASPARGAKAAGESPSPGLEDAAIERMCTRGAAGFRNDIVKRNAKIKGGRKRASD